MIRPSSRKLFSPKDDEILKAAVEQVGENWEEVANIVTKFNARQCKERYTVYLKKSYRTDPWTKEEDQLLLELYEKMGPRWCQISEFFDGRHSNSVKNRWHRYLSKTAPRRAGRKAGRQKSARSTKAAKDKVKAKPKEVKAAEIEESFYPAEFQSDSEFNDVEQVINSQLLSLNSFSDPSIDDLKFDIYNDFLL